MWQNLCFWRRLSVSLITISSFLPGYEWQSAWASSLNLPPVGLPGRRVGGGTRLFEDGGNEAPERMRSPLPATPPAAPIVPPSDAPADPLLLPPARPVPLPEIDSPREEQCLQGNPPLLVALLPETNVGFTTVESPRFFWFMPQTTAQVVEFTLYEGDATLPKRRLVYERRLDVPQASGIMSLQLPTDGRTRPKLSSGKDYHWTLSLVCNPNNRQQNISVEGWVRRVSVNRNLNRQLSRANERDHISLYAENGLWFDLIATLAELRCTRPEDEQLTQQWIGYFEAVNLPEIADRPLLFCQE